MNTSNNPINNTVGASISGVTNTLTVTNASNTASSAARSKITVGGGSAADPTINFNVSGVTDWEMGIDNSDSDKLKINPSSALGSGDAWIMTKAGERTMPLQPAFFANLSTSTANDKTGDGSSYTAICDTVIYDQNSDYNNTTGIFTAPISGRYHFSSAISAINIGPAHTGYRNFHQTTSAITYYQGGGCNSANCRSNANGYSASLSSYINLDAGDTVFLIINVNGGAKTIGLEGSNSTLVTFFGGKLVC